MLRMKVVMTAFLMAIFSLFGCSNGTETETNTGDLSMALTTPGGMVIEEVDWTITQDGTSYTRSGTINAADPEAVISAIINGLPVGMGYHIEFTATTSNGASCTASADFEIVAGEITYVNMTLQCRSIDDVETLVLGGEVNICPVITFATAAPQTAWIGSPIALYAEAEDNDGDSLTALWSSDGMGAFDPANMLETSYECALPPSTHTLTLTVTDSHDNPNTPEEDTCATSIQVPVECIGHGYCPNGLLEGPFEQCDDGNTDPCDGCDELCQIEVCGNGIVDCGEECDDGVNDGTNCYPDCTPYEPFCWECAEANCTDYMGQDVYTACDDAANNGECHDVIICLSDNAYMNDPLGAYCGTADPDTTCLIGMADGPCKARIEVASDTSDPFEILERMTNTAYPMGDAYQLTYCLIPNCSTECGLY